MARWQGYFFAYKNLAMKENLIRTLCGGTCKGSTRHKILKEFVVTNTNLIESDSGEYEDSYSNSSYYQEDKYYQIIQCMGCESVSFREVIKAENKLIDEKLFPKRDKTNIEIKDFGISTPRKLKILYDEVINAFNNQFGVLCAAGVRGIIEGVCSENGIEGGMVVEIDKRTRKAKVDSSGNTKFRKSTNLDGKIEGLADKGFITKENTTMLHKVRFLGNKAVHELDKPTPDQLIIAIKIVEHLLESIYTIKTEADKLQLTE